jgi:endonuclease YncB( thermonuclease family)
MKANKSLWKLLFATLMLALAVSACSGGGGTNGGGGATATRAPTTTSVPEEPPPTQTLVEPTPPASDLVEAQVTRVVDGDTIHVLIDGVEYRLRYIGIDTPETKHPTRGVEPFGPEASQANSELVEGRTVWLEKDVSETDRYGRLLRYVYVNDLMVNEELLRRGLARVATFPPDVKYVDRFLELQRAAQEGGLGLWGPEGNQAEPAPAAALASAPASEAWGYTYQRPDGNRLVPGKGALPGVEPLDIRLDGQPQWLVAAPLGEGSVWVAVLADSRVQAFHVVGRDVTSVAIEPDQLPPGMPPLLRVTDDVPGLVANPTDLASPLTHPVVLPASGEQLAFIESSGDLVIWDGDEAGRIATNALPDARLLVDESARLLLLTEPTTRYDHGVLGDGAEGSSISLIETAPTPRVARRIELAPPSVVEGIAPIWTDLTGDGGREIIVTLSDPEGGARLAVYSEAGEQLAVGSAIGRGYRWRHQLVVAPFGPTGDLELADVMTPHIGGIVEFFQLAGDRLKLMSQTSGYSSHVLGSRNLDMAVAGDFDGDGRVELLLPDQERSSLGAVRRVPGGAEVAWGVPVGERISTNLAAVAFPDGTLAVGVGHDGDQLRLWLP